MIKDHEMVSFETDYYLDYFVEMVDCERWWYYLCDEIEIKE